MKTIRLLPNTLVGRVIGLFTLTWLLCVVLGGAMFIYSEFKDHIATILGQSVMLIELCSQVISESAVIGDYDTMRRVLDTSVSQSMFGRIDFIDLNGGRISSETRLDPSLGIVSDWVEPLLLERMPTVNRSITVGGTDYGVLRFYFEARTLANDLQNFAAVTGLISLLSFSLGLLLIWLPLRGWIRPLADTSNNSPLGDKAGAFDVSEQVLNAAPAEFHAVLRKMSAAAKALNAELQEKETALRLLMELTRKYSANALDKPNSMQIAPYSLDQAARTISALFEERAAVAKAVSQAKHAAEQANQAKTAFLAAISHDIRTPMNGILAMASVLVDEEKDQGNPRRREILETIFKSASSLLSLLNDVLDISQIESGKMEIRPNQFSVDQLVLDCVSTFSQNAENAGTVLRIGDKTGATFSGDPSRLKQMIGNLISNAIKFSPGGIVELTVAITGAGEEPRMLTVMVKDDGPGISAKQQQKLFMPFSQIEEIRTHQHGSGLGLSIVRKLAEIMGGSVGVISELGRGSTFHFTVRESKISPSDVKVQSDTELGGLSVANIGSIQGKKVMVVDDTHSNLFVLEVLLKKLGADVWTFDNAEEALSLFEHGQTVDIILMDLQMPGMDGVTATKILRQWETANSCTRTPIIAVTAAAFVADRTACIEAGMDGFLTKPILFEPLRKTLCEFLDRVPTVIPVN